MKSDHLIIIVVLCSIPFTSNSKVGTENKSHLVWGYLTGHAICHTPEGRDDDVLFVGAVNPAVDYAYEKVLSHGLNLRDFIYGYKWAIRNNRYGYIDCAQPSVNISRQYSTRREAQEARSAETNPNRFGTTVWISPGIINDWKLGE